MKRVSHEPAYILHHYDWSESSVITECLTRTHGRMTLVAKGAKRPSSHFRAVLLPLQPLLLSWGGDAEIRSLKSAEWGGGLVMPRGDALLSGYYANELLLRLLPREDPHPALFDAYAALVHVLATADADALGAAALRAFELLLLRETGHLPALDSQTLTLAPLHSRHTYRLVPEGGLRAAHADDPHWLPGQAWQQISQALQDAAPLSQTLTLLSHWPAEQRGHLRRQLAELLHHHCGRQNLRTRQLMADVRALQAQG